jgi:hypothetical protein
MPADLVRIKSQQAVRAASHHLFHGPSWMSRIGGGMPHEAPREGTTQLKKVGVPLRGVTRRPLRMLRALNATRDDTPDA